MLAKLVTRSAGPLAAILIASALCGCGEIGPEHVALVASPGGGESPRLSLKGPPDAELEQRLSGIFGQLDDLKDVQVSVRQGVAHLTGTTDTASSAGRAHAFAARLDGIIYVKDDIVQPPSRWGPLAPTWRALRRLGLIAWHSVPRAIAALLVLVPFALLSRALGRWASPFQVLDKKSLKGNLIRLGLQGAAIILGILVALDVAGLLATAGAVVGALGVIGIVIGLVFKDWVSIYLPGMMLGFHPPFKVGDLIRIGEHMGRVARLTPSSTVLVTLDAEEVRIPNAEFFRAVLTNFSRHRKRRLRIPVSLALRADLGSAAELGCKAILGVPGVQADPPPFMRVNRQEGEHVDVEFFAWMDQDEASFLNVEGSAVRTVLEALVASAVPLPATTVTIRRPQHEQGGEAIGAAHLGAGASESDAESRDEAFVAEEFTRTRTADGERDLLTFRETTAHEPS